jgi:hypothetical protein
MRGLPSPLNVPPSLFWDGIDGRWSTFHVSVGTPGQAVRLLPGTSATASDTTVRNFQRSVLIVENCADPFDCSGSSDLKAVP